MIIIELEEYIELCQRDNIITKSFLQNKFTLAVAEFIVVDYHKDYDKKQRSYDAICEILEPGYMLTEFEVVGRGESR